MSGIERIVAERQRQIQTEGYSLEHDTRYVNLELIRAASCYVEYATGLQMGIPREALTKFVFPRWPWAARYFKPSEDPARNIEKAGALLAAEIDRLDPPDSELTQFLKQFGEANLGLATTRQIMEELRARGIIGQTLIDDQTEETLNYRTVNHD